MILFFTQQKSIKVKAFTLLEVLTSFAIVTLVILGPLTFSINSAAYSKQSKDIITSQYLAQEALELLHYQYDTLYIACTNEVDTCSPANFPSDVGETKGATAWRLFKTRLDDTSLPGTVSCFSDSGCSYDFLDMLDAVTVAPPKKYSPTGTECPKLSMVYSALNDTILNYYVCSSIDQTDVDNRLKDNHYTVKLSAYTRKVKVESIPTYEISSLPGSANLDLYQDDLIVKSIVSFRRSNGILREIEVVDFIHARL